MRKRVASSRALAMCLFLSACSSAPPPPDWKMNAVGLIEHFQESWLQGDGKTASLALGKARGEIARSGRIDLVARAELAACATRAAALDFSPCVAYQKLSAEAGARDAAYAHFLAGEWSGLDAKALPSHYTDLVGARDAEAANRAAAAIREPLPRLIAAALLFERGTASPATVADAVDTASERGWRRPLLAWLQVLSLRAQTAGDTHAVARLQDRIDLIRSTPASD